MSSAHCHHWASHAQQSVLGVTAGRAVLRPPLDCVLLGTGLQCGCWPPTCLCRELPVAGDGTVREPLLSGSSQQKKSAVSPDPLGQWGTRPGPAQVLFGDKIWVRFGFSRAPGVCATGSPGLGPLCYSLAARSCPLGQGSEWPGPEQSGELGSSFL